MIRYLTYDQLLLLRRCSGGLHIFESGPERAALKERLDLLRQLKLVSFDEHAGYETTAAGEACLVNFNP